MSSLLVPKPKLPSSKICTPESEDCPRTPCAPSYYHPATEIIVCVGSRAVDNIERNL